MSTVYDRITRYIVEAGKTLVEKQRHVVDIGIKKQWLTEEDLRIERMIETIIKDNDTSHELYAEEEHDSFPKVENVWVADPISGTRSYIDGSPNYSIAVAHMQRGVVQFSAVYHPPADELFISRRGGGSFLNGEKIKIIDSDLTKKPFIFQKTFIRRNDDWGMETLQKMKELGDVAIADGSTAMCFCQIACGRNRGMITFAKDVFPSIVASLIIREAGGVFTNGDGDIALKPTDRIFIAGSAQSHALLLKASA